MGTKKYVLKNGHKYGTLLEIDNKHIPVTFVSGMRSGQNGFLMTSDEKIQSALEKHPDFQIKFVLEQGQPAFIPAAAAVTDVPVITTTQEAIDFLVKNHGAKEEELKSKKAIVAFAESKGIGFSNLK